MQFAWGYIPTFVLEAAVRHPVFDVLDSGPKTLKETAAATGASERGLRTIMNVLVGLNFLAKTEAQQYTLTPESEAFLVSTKPGFHGGILKHTSAQLIPKWLKLNEIVGTGKPAAQDIRCPGVRWNHRHRRVSGGRRSNRTGNASALRSEHAGQHRRGRYLLV